MNQTELEPKNYYRLPWSLNDNVLSWLEPTKRCNLYCEGCYSRNDPKSDKTLDQVRRDLQVFVTKRKSDSISIAGGDPLVHPQIVDIVRMIKQDFGKKPVINTNGLALTPDLLKDLKRAGLYGLTFHIDSSQQRKDWKRMNELDLCELRLKFAEMVAREGGLSTAFNATIFRHTLQYVPDLMAWAAKHIDIVHTMVFILFRTMRTREFDYFANGKKIDTVNPDVVYYDQDQNPEPLTAREVVGKIKERYPDFDPCAYLGGTKDPESFKWLLAGRLGTTDDILGYVGPKYMETVQSVHHMLWDRYVAYVNPELLSAGRSMMLGFSALDGGVRGAAKSYLRKAARRPWKLAKKVHFQSITIIQPIDMTQHGEANMCDGCPDMTVHDGELVWSCRLDERVQYGCFLQGVPKAVTAREEGLTQIRLPDRSGQGEVREPPVSH